MPKLDDATRARILELHAQGLGRNQIVKETGVSGATVTRICRANGAEFDRSMTRAAVDAHQTDLAARRAAIIDRLFTRTETILDRLEAPTYKCLVPIAPGKQATRTLSFVPAGEEYQLGNTVTGYMSSVQKLAPMDTEIQAAKSMADQIIAGLGMRTGVDNP